MALLIRSIEAKLKYPNQLELPLKYGTAGFRTKAERLVCCAFRTGILAALRAKQKQKEIGVMITASHNPVEDNGVKIVDPNGEMLEMQWESYATSLVNAQNDDLENAVARIIKETGIEWSQGGSVYIGMDTRPSSEGLLQACKDGVEAAGCSAKSFGVVTTPMLHYFVWCKNCLDADEANEEGYFQRLGDAYKQFHSLCKTPTQAKVTLDGANGVGSFSAKKIQPHLRDFVNVEVVFDGSNGELNYQCGADYVKTTQGAPVGLSLNSEEKYASFDGDADRLVYYYVDKDNTFHLMDGDKIATLVAGYLKELLHQAELTEVKLGLVQTAYANGSSTVYISEQLGVPVACARTGVKHLHHEALNFDIGVYFEANGHGTVLFSELTEKLIESAANSGEASSTQGKACLKLSALLRLINQCVGDALSDMLLVEAVLMDREWSIIDWDKQYTDIPNRLVKVMVSDRSVIQVTDAERRTVSPPALQPLIDNEVMKYSRGRAFVRPSGTEDCVRVYAEASSVQEVNDLIYAVSSFVYEHAGGVGPAPLTFK